jgi:hypothetical protein
MWLILMAVSGIYRQPEAYGCELTFLKMTSFR